MLKTSYRCIKVCTAEVKYPFLILLIKKVVDLIISAQSIFVQKVKNQIIPEFCTQIAPDEV